MKTTLLTLGLSLLCFNSFAAQTTSEGKKEKNDSRKISSFQSQLKNSNLKQDKKQNQINASFQEVLRNQLTSKNHMKI